MSPKVARRGFIIFLLLLLMGVIYGIYWMRQPYHLPVKHVGVGGQLHFVSTTEVQNIVLPYVTQGFFNVKAQALQARLMAIPGIKSVRISRRFPSSIQIQIQEKQAIATYSNALVDTQGVVFSPKLKNNLATLPQFVGAQSQLPNMVKNYQVWSKTLLPLGLAISTVQVDSINQWDFVLAKGAKIFLGSDHLQQRFQRFVSAYSALLASNPKKTLVSVDMRYGGEGFAARWS